MNRELVKNQDLSPESLRLFVHDIKNPLNAIVGFSELLEDTSLTEEQQDILQLIQRSCQNLQKVLDQKVPPTL